MSSTGIFTKTFTQALKFKNHQTRELKEGSLDIILSNFPGLLSAEAKLPDRVPEFLEEPAGEARTNIPSCFHFHLSTSVLPILLTGIPAFLHFLSIANPSNNIILFPASKKPSHELWNEKTLLRTCFTYMLLCLKSHFSRTHQGYSMKTYYIQLIN